MRAGFAGGRRGAADTAAGRQCGGCSGRDTMRRTGRGNERSVDATGRGGHGGGARRTRRTGGNAADAAEETQCGGRGAGMNGASIQRGAADTADGRQCGGCSGREAMRRTMHTPAAVRSRCVATQRRRRASAAQTGRPANERADGWTNRRMYGHAGIIIDLRAGRPAGTRRTRRDARGYDTRLSAGGVPPGSVRERLRRSMRSTITATAPSPVTLVAVPKLSMAM